MMDSVNRFLYEMYEAKDGLERSERNAEQLRRIYSTTREKLSESEKELKRVRRAFSIFVEYADREEIRTHEDAAGRSMHSIIFGD